MKKSAGRGNRISRVLEYVRALPHLLSLRGNFLVEGSRLCALLAPILATRGKVFCLAADDFSYALQHKPGFLDRLLFRSFHRYVRGIVSVGNLNEQAYGELCPQIPLVLAFPPVDEQKIERLLALKPALESHNILFIGAGNPYCKGVDIAIEAVAQLCAEYPDAQLFLAGQTMISSHRAVRALGWVKDLTAVLTDSSLLIQPGRGDAFPVSCVEALASGLPILVSEHTGSYVIAARLSPKFVLKLDPGEFAHAIREIWSMKQDQRSLLSNLAKQIALQYLAEVTEKTDEVRAFLLKAVGDGTRTLSCAIAAEPSEDK
jgi:glycosyltransferase involved in cell wall biosynthesis